MLAALTCLFVSCAPVPVAGYWRLRVECGAGSMAIEQQGARVHGTIEACGAIASVEGVVSGNELVLPMDGGETRLAIADRYASAPGIEAWLDDPPDGDADQVNRPKSDETDDELVADLMSMKRRKPSAPAPRLTRAQEDALSELGFIRPASAPTTSVQGPCSDWSDPQQLRRAVQAQFREARQRGRARARGAT